MLTTLILYEKILFKIVLKVIRLGTDIFLDYNTFSWDY